MRSAGDSWEMSIFESAMEGNLRRSEPKGKLGNGG